MSDRTAAYGRRVNPILSPTFRLGKEPPNKGKKYPPEVYTPGEVQAVMARCGRGPGGYRNRAMIAVMWRSGLRVSEVVALQRKDVDADLGAVTVLHGKGDKRRMVALDAETAALIELWYTGPRARLRLGPGKPLFCTYERGIAGQPLRTAYIRTALHRAAKSAGVEKRFVPHGLRHTYAFELLREGYDVVTIQRALGHEDLRTTQRYLSHLAPIDVLEALQRRQPWLDAATIGHPCAAPPRTNSLSRAAGSAGYGSAAPATVPAAVA